MAAPGNRPRLAVTGARGRLGRHVREALRGAWNVVDLDINAPTGGASAKRVDVTDLDGLRSALSGCDAVVHLAGASSPRAGPAEEIYRVNAVGAWCVAQAAQEVGIRRLVYCSSDYVTGVCGSNPVPPRYLPVDEDHPAQPTEAYGASKEAGEATCRLAARAGGMAVVILRPTLILFPDDAKTALEQRDDPRNPDVWSHVRPEDAARAFRLAAEAERPGCRAFFITADRTLSRVPTLDLVARRFGHLPEIRKPDVYERNPHAPVFDTTRARLELGFRAASG